jgi:D-glycero-D-manno-heptose 1,7-bisphosphate phosphatase
MKQKTVFLDRDGTLIEEVNFLHRVDDLRFFSYTDESVKLLKESGYRVIVVTNQSGIAREMFSEADMHGIHNAIQNHLTKKIDAFYFCPHFPDDGCTCRKPNLGMIEQACKDFEIDLENSWMIGDKLLDVELGFKANIKTAMVKTGYGEKDQAQLSKKPTLIEDTLIRVVQNIINS